MMMLNNLFKNNKSQHRSSYLYSYAGAAVIAAYARFSERFHCGAAFGQQFSNVFSSL